jgi:hypothetical protein
MVYIYMTFLVSAFMGAFCAVPVLIGQYVNPISGAFGAFIGGFLVALPVSGIGAALIYILLNSFVVQFILATWLIAFSFLNYMETEYVIINNKGIVKNAWLALAFALPVYVFYWSITYT